jgi:hypothetical protein
VLGQVLGTLAVFEDYMQEDEEDRRDRSQCPECCEAALAAVADLC